MKKQRKFFSCVFRKRLSQNTKIQQDMVQRYLVSTNILYENFILQRPLHERSKMQGFNCILVYSADKSKILLCKRRKDPYIGLYNLVGGKIEPEEEGINAAYRELYEETGILRSDITLYHFMDFTYYKDSCYVEVYGGYLEHAVDLKEEAHPLVWLDSNEDFFDSERFAGEGNIGHMVEYVRKYGL